MKTFKELVESSLPIYIELSDNDWAEPEQSIRKLGEVFGKEVGVFGFKDNIERYIYLPEDEIRKGAFKELSLNTGEYIVRFVTLKSSIGNGLAPLVKINPSKGLVYFLDDYESEDMNFESKGQKVAWLRTSLK